jgi:5'(3')-deoxyribonucleotidase
MGKPIIHLDMDGVIVDLFGYAADITGVTDTKELSQEQFDKFFAGHDAEELFADLPKFDSADKLISIIDQLAGSYNILSSPLAEDKPGSIRGKNRWLDNNISIMPAKRVFDHEKYKYAKQSDGTPNILIDDYKFNINKCREAGGIAIRYRADRMSPEDIVTELKIALDNGGNETISERLSRRWYAVKSAVNESDVEMKLSPESKLIDEVELSETLKRVKGKWALVSKSNPKKVLQYYRGGDERPSKEWVNKVERRVHSFGEDAELNEMGGVGVVATNPKMAKDPRYSTSMTVDVGPGETQKQAKKMGFNTDKLGIPPRLSPSGVVPRKKPPK